MAKLTSMEKALRVENNRIKKSFERIQEELDSMQGYVSFLEGQNESLIKGNRFLRKLIVLYFIGEGDSYEEAEKRLENIRNSMEIRSAIEGIYEAFEREMMEEYYEKEFDVNEYLHCQDEIFEVKEIGFDSFLDTAEDLIADADFHCRSYSPERDSYLPIDSVGKAIKYFEDNGFIVREMNA